MPLSFFFFPQKAKFGDRLLMKPFIFLKSTQEKGTNNQGPKFRQAKQPKNKGRIIPFSENLVVYCRFFRQNNNNHNNRSIGTLGNTGHVKNPVSTMYIHFEDTNLSECTQILQFEQEVSICRSFSFTHTLGMDVLV